MSPGRDPPFFAGSILGLRAWVVRPQLPSSRTRLGAAVADANWAPGGAWTEASCRPLGGAGPGERAHPAPRATCSCGLYGFHPRAEVARQLHSGHVHGELEADVRDPRFIETVGVIGLVEACGRIELHESGFRAERARPLALVAGRRWPSRQREAVAELAALYGAEVLEISGPRELLAFAEERGGVLSEERVGELLPESVAPSPAPQLPPTAPAGPSPPPPPAPAPKPDSLGAWLARAWEWTVQAVVILLFGVVGLLYYGTIAGFVVMLAGGILFGWFDEEVKRPPAKVLAVKIDRERCVVAATVRARRDLGHLDLRVDGNLRNGDSLGKHTFKLGSVDRGRSRLVVARPDPGLCRSRHHFTLRVRPVWPELVGKPAEARSRFKGPADVRKEAQAPTPPT